MTNDVENRLNRCFTVDAFRFFVLLLVMLFCDNLLKSLLFVCKARRNATLSHFRDVYGPPPAIVWISPVDAVSFGIKSGDDVTVFNELGAMTVEAVVTENVSTGVLWSPRPLTGGLTQSESKSRTNQACALGPVLLGKESPREDDSDCR